MTSRAFLLLVTLGFVLPASAELKPAPKPAAKADSAIKPGERGIIKFKESPPQSDAEQIKLRLHAVETPPDYDVENESFEILVPKNYNKSVPHGLLIWISPGGDAKISKEWEAVLAEKKIIFIGAKNSGNPRNLFDRARMAIDANVNMRDLYNIDGRRVYVSGFSGGARVASMVGVCYAEMFSGTACFMGVNFYQDILCPDNMVYRMNYVPDEDVLAIAKKACRYALITGEKDPNHANTMGMFENGFKKEGFAAVQAFDIPSIGHTPPSAEWFRKVIEFLDQGKK